MEDCCLSRIRQTVPALAHQTRSTQQDSDNKIAVLQEKSSKTFGKGSAQKLLIIWKGNSSSLEVDPVGRF